MTGFLTQLVARGLGQADVARPRPVSRFEPLSLADAAPLAPDLSPADTGLEEASEAAPPPPSRAASRRAHLPAPTLPDDGDLAAVGPERRAPWRGSPTEGDAPAPAMPSPTVTVPVHSTPNLTVVVCEASPTRTDTAPAGLTPPAVETGPPPSVGSAPSLTPAASEPPTTAVTPMQRILIQPEVRPLAPRAAPPSSVPSLPPPISSGPTVHVTIGRLEVRASPPPTPARTPRPAEPSPPVKLDEYLRQRGGRGTG